MGKWVVCESIFSFSFLLSTIFSIYFWFRLVFLNSSNICIIISYICDTSGFVSSVSLSLKSLN